MWLPVKKRESYNVVLYRDVFFGLLFMTNGHIVWHFFWSLLNLVCLYMELCSTHRLTISTSRPRATRWARVALFPLNGNKVKQ